ncbi:MAG: gluconate:H+ symporter [Salinivirgaceae bacterium]|jgi:Gnt-I system low-affinity gluconate transporter|nr:gluconate:H+ symporter [Salinivirgaceae bacterium]
MATYYLIFIVISAVSLLLFLVLKLKLNAFIGLLITAIYVGILSGMPLQGILKSIEKGMAGTLGFVAIVVGLGAIFGQMLESSGGAESMANYLINKFGVKNAPIAMTITGFIIAIPVFLDVGFIILVPIIYALSRDTGKPLLYFGIPLLAGLAVTHSFIPPTPGPVAVANIINVQLGWVILFGFILGVPTAIIAGPIFGKFISKKVKGTIPFDFHTNIENKSDNKALIKPRFRLIVILIGIPLLLIIASSVTSLLVGQSHLPTNYLTELIVFLGHPFCALIIATLLSIWFLGIKRGLSKQQILDLSTKSLGPAGIIILITGAGGVLKQVLIESSIGEILANSLAESALSPLLLAWILAALIRVTQGSATVAMITAAGIIAPVIETIGMGEMQRALVVIAIASGATILSHVNDSGFWLVGKYFGLNEKQTLQSWTAMETIIAFCGLIFCLIAGMVIS